MAILKAIAQICPNGEGIKAPSKLEAPIEVTEEMFVNEYADYGKAGKVSFAADGISNPQAITVYRGEYILIG